MGPFGGQTLVVLPGVSAATDVKYAGVYGLLRDLAGQAGFARVEMCAWPGQAPCPPEEEVTLEGAVARARATIARLQAEKRRFSLLGRSFGNMVAAYIAGRDAPVEGLDRLILWGPPPMYVVWTWFRRDLESTAAMVRGRGVRITEEFYRSMIPIEVLLEEVRCPVRLGLGTIDPQVPSDFRAHLAAFASTRPHVTIREVAGAVHEVGPDDPPERRAAYAAALFGP